MITIHSAQQEMLYLTSHSTHYRSSRGHVRVRSWPVLFVSVMPWCRPSLQSGTLMSAAAAAAV